MSKPIRKVGLLMAEIQLSGTAWIDHRIHDYCEEWTNGSGGSYQQADYKHEYFYIFIAYLICDLCGYQAQEKFRRRLLKLKNILSHLVIML
jgi:hypothetical protein